MTYKQLNMDEVTMIHLYLTKHAKVSLVATTLARSRQTVHNLFHVFDEDQSPLDYWRNYQHHKAKCGRKRKVLLANESKYINQCIDKGWTPDTIIGKRHKGAVMTLVERQSKLMISLNVHEKSAAAIEAYTVT